MASKIQINNNKMKTRRRYKNSSNPNLKIFRNFSLSTLLLRLNHISSRLLENNYEYYTFVIANLNVINVVVVKILIQLFETSRKLFSHLSFPLYNIPR